MADSTYAMIEVVKIHGLKDKVIVDKHDFYLDVDLVVNEEALFEHVPIHYEDLFCNKEGYKSLIQFFYNGNGDCEEDWLGTLEELFDYITVGEVLFSGSFIKNDIEYCKHPGLLETMEIVYQKYFLFDETRAPKEYNLVDYSDWKDYFKSDYSEQKELEQKWKTAVTKDLFATNNLDEVLS